MPFLEFRLNAETLRKMTQSTAETISSDTRGIVAETAGKKPEEVEARWPEPDRFTSNSLPFAVYLIGEFSAGDEQETQSLRDGLRIRLVKYLAASSLMPESTKFDVWVMPLAGGSYGEGVSRP